jgi:signal transduction histidine kinase
MSRWNLTILEASQYALLLFAGLVIYQNQDGVALALAVFLLAVQAGVCYFWPQQHPRLLLGLELALACGLVAVEGQVWFVGLLLSVHAMMLVSRNRGLLWIGAYILFFTTRTILADGALDGLTYGFFTAVSMLSLGMFTAQRTELFKALKESRQLLDELKEANRKLQESAAQGEALAIMDERSRLARELHDSAKQEAFAAAAQLAAAREWFARDPQKASQHLTEAEKLVDSVRQELTGLIQQLRPPALEGKGLALALKEYAENWSRQSGIAVEVAVSGERPLPLNLELDLFRIAQEALANTARHSQAGRATILLAISSDAILLEERDDGAGFSPDSIREGLGLESMRRRAAALCGGLEVESATGKGTRLTLRCPLPPDTGAMHA